MYVCMLGNIIEKLRECIPVYIKYNLQSRASFCWCCISINTLRDNRN